MKLLSLPALPSARRLALGLGLACACAGSTPPPTAPVENDLVVDPDLGATYSRGTAPQPVAVATPVDHPIDEDAFTPIDAADFATREPMPLDGNDLVIEDLAIRDMPNGVRVYRVRTRPETFELLDAAGSRIAIVERADWTHVSEPGGQPIGPVQIRERTLRLHEWGDHDDASVVMQRWSDDRYVYRVDRLPDASWVGLQLELDPRIEARPVARNEANATERDAAATGGDQ